MNHTNTKTALPILFLGLIFVTLGSPSLFADESTDSKTGPKAVYDFQSEKDRFQILETDTGFGSEQKKLELDSLSVLKDIFSLPFENECLGLDQKENLSIQRTLGKEKVTLRIFLNSQMIAKGSEDPKCVLVTSEALYFLPLKKNWLNPGQGTIKILPEISLRSQQGELFKIEKKDKEWVSSDPQKYLNSDFLEKWIDSLKTFPIQSKAHVGLTKSKPKYSVTVGSGSLSESYSLFMLSPGRWALQRGESQEIEISKNWAFWNQLESGLWQDAFAPQLQALCNKDLPYASRMDAMGRINDLWTASVRSCLRQILLDSGESEDLKIHAALQLRGKPTYENYRILALALEKTENPKLQSQWVKVLRILNPKGPALKEAAAPSERKTVLAYWVKWYSHPQKPNP